MAQTKTPEELLSNNIVVDHWAPDKNLIEFTRIILRQNEIILKANCELLKFIGRPIIIYKGKDEK